MNETKRFLDNGDQTVTDLQTGLIWDQRDVCLMNWFEALEYCSNLHHAGKEDWRLPTREELESLVQRDRTEAPLLDPTFFPNVVANHYWTNETTEAGTTAFYVSFNRGKTGRRTKKLKNYVRAVWLNT